MRAESKASLANQRAVAREEAVVRLHFQFTDRWESDSMHRSRTNLARQLLRGDPDKDIDEPVMVFFEEVGALHGQGRLNEDLAYEGFSYYVKGWWPACRPFIQRLRRTRQDTSLYERFENFADHMLNQEAVRRRKEKAELSLTDQEVRQFLEEEDFSE